jgi:hypothetical protein
MEDDKEVSLQDLGTASWTSENTVPLPEREDKSLHVLVEESDLKCPISNGLWLLDQLVQTLARDGTVALLINVDATSGPGRLAIDKDPESDRRTT